MSDNPQPSSTNASLKIKIKKIVASGHWRWVANDDICGICRYPFEICCHSCKRMGIYPSQCPPEKGNCNHYFHKHCITEWIATRNSNKQCPICRQEWQGQQRTISN